MSKTAVEDLLKVTDLIADLLDEREIEFEGFDAQEFLRDTIPVIVESVVDETAQRVYRRVAQELITIDPENAGRIRAYFEGLIDPEFESRVSDDWYGI